MSDRLHITRPLRNTEHIIHWNLRRFFERKGFSTTNIKEEQSLIDDNIEISRWLIKPDLLRVDNSIMHVFKLISSDGKKDQLDSIYCYGQSRRVFEHDLEILKKAYKPI